MPTVPVATPPSAPLEPSFREFVALVREDWVTHDRDAHKPGFQALFAYRLGVYRMTIRKSVLRKPLSVAYQVLQRRARNRLSIELTYTARIGRRVKIVHQGAIVVHPHAVIGDECLLRQGVALGTGVAWDPEDRPVLGRGVRLGVGAVLVGTIVVGDEARIGPNAVVTSHVPAGARVMAARPRVFPPAALG